MAVSILIYLAGPLDDLEEGGDALTWREQLENVRSDVALVSPQHAFIKASYESAESVILANRSMIYVSDGLLAYLDGGWPFGTIREIEYAKSLGKPVSVASKRPPMSLASFDLTWNPTPQIALDELLVEIGALKMEMEHEYPGN